MPSRLHELRDDLATLEQAMRSGITSVSVGGQTTTFAQPSDMRAIIADIKQEIAECEGAEVSRPRVSSFNLSRGV